jgi:two-component system, chemotaxis family, sensor kinase CheA
MGDPLLERLVGEFAVEADELVQRITRNVLALERARPGAEPPEGAHEEVARALHTLKGSAATVGLADLSELAHRMEDAYAPVLAARAGVPAPLADALLGALDTAMEWLRARAAGRDAQDLAGRLRRIGAFAPPSAGAPAPDAAGEREAPAQAGAPLGEGKVGWRVAARHVEALVRDLEGLREIRLRVEQRARDVGRALEDLGRLGLLAQLAEPRALLLGVRAALARDAADLGEQLDGLDGAVKAICTVPVHTLLEPLERAVRDVCRASGKEAALSLVGGEISLDRRVLEALRGPLLHLVRNAVDHGIEPPDVRREQGKASAGAVVLRVEQQGNVAFLEVADDGAGLDAGRIREAAERRGVASRDELSRMGPDDLVRLVFRSGFTTSETVTEISGRGVGLDAVRAQIQALHGSVDVHSAPRQGTRFTLSVPTDVGTSPVLLVRAGGALFGLPMLALEAVVPARCAQVHLGRGHSRFEHEGRILPLFDLGALAGLRQALPPAEGQPLLVLQGRSDRAALLVDAILVDRDLAVHPLPAELSGIAAYQGAATLADGELALVLRPEWLVHAERRAEEVAESARRALVVDDSLTARAMHRVMLEAGGFTVHALASASEAADRLRQASYDVVVCDVGMAGMDGLAFTRLLRDRAETRAVPVVLVSGRDAAGDRAAGLAAGADAYISKRDCAAGLLLSEVSAAMARRSGA